MIRISTIFIGICMALIAASLGLALYAVAGISGAQSAVIALAALTCMIIYNAISMRLRDRPDIGGQIADLSQGTADLARQVGEFGRRLAAIEARIVSANSMTQDRIQSALGEISELGGLVNQLAESVAAHDDLLASDPRGSTGPAAVPETAASRAPVVELPASDRRGEAAVLADESDDDYLDFEDAAQQQGDAHILATVKTAIEANRIDIYLQPMVTLPQRKVRFYEAVTRLRDDKDQVLTADDFIGTAEAAGLMGQIDHMVMLRSVQVLRRLMLRNKDVGVFCNVAAATLSDPVAFAQCLDFLEANRAVAASFVLEFKQSTMRSLGAVEREHLAALAQRGYRFSIDHVTDLRMEPRELADRGVRFIKVPAALLLDQKTMSSSDIHAADLSDLLGRFGIDLIAERIEGERAVVDLLDYDVRFGQGFLFAAPRPLRPEAAPASAGSPSPAAAPDKARQDSNGSGKSSEFEAVKIDARRTTGNAALARRAGRPI